MAKKEFHISDVLSVGTGILVGDNHMQGVHNICGFMVQGNFSTIGLLHVAKPCKESLQKQYPWMAKLELIDYETQIKGLPKEESQRKIDKWLKPIIQEYGEYLVVKTI